MHRFSPFSSPYRDILRKKLVLLPRTFKSALLSYAAEHSANWQHWSSDNDYFFINPMRIDWILNVWILFIFENIYRWVSVLPTGRRLPPPPPPTCSINESAELTQGALARKFFTLVSSLNGRVRGPWRTCPMSWVGPAPPHSSARPGTPSAAPSRSLLSSLQSQDKSLYRSTINKVVRFLSWTGIPQLLIIALKQFQIS